jgi:hypothetical protein
VQQVSIIQASLIDNKEFNGWIAQQSLNVKHLNDNTKNDPTAVMTCRRVCSYPYMCLISAVFPVSYAFMAITTHKTLVTVISDPSNRSRQRPKRLIQSPPLSMRHFTSTSDDHDDNDIFQPQPPPPQQQQTPVPIFARGSLGASEKNSLNDEPSVSSSSYQDENDTSLHNIAATATAATNTINQRLLSELQQAETKERLGPRSSLGEKWGFMGGDGRPRKTDEERKAAIAEARDLNGVNPIVAIVGSFFALAVAAILWITTNKLGGWFVTHPPDTEIYFVLRTAQVFRNVVMGLISLASGFFGVTGLGIFLLGVRVAYGVATGELDPTPIQKKSTILDEPPSSSVNLGNMLDLMMNRKPGRRGGRTKKDNDMFGL